MNKKYYIVLQHDSDGEGATPLRYAYRTKNEAIDAAIQEIDASMDLYCDDDEENDDEDRILKRARKELTEQGYTDCYREQCQFDTYQIDCVWVPVTNDDMGLRLCDADIVKKVFKAQNLTQKRVNSLYPNLFLEHFLATDSGEGYCLLCSMGFFRIGIPFNIKKFLTTGETSWVDTHGNMASMSFKLEGNKVFSHASYRGKENSDVYEIDDIDEYTATELYKLQSELIGEECSRTLYNVFPFDEYPFPEDEIDD